MPHKAAAVAVSVYYSDDGGQRWSVSATSMPGDESTLAELDGGAVMINARHGQDNLTWPIPCHCRAVAVSSPESGGHAFAPPSWLPRPANRAIPLGYDPALISPSSGTAASGWKQTGGGCEGALLRHNSSLFFVNPAHTEFRVDLTLRRSDDGGRSWSRSLLIWPFVGESGYSSLASFGSSHVAVAYEGTNATGGGVGLPPNKRVVEACPGKCALRDSRWRCEPQPPSCNPNVLFGTGTIKFTIVPSSLDPDKGLADGEK